MFAWAASRVDDSMQIVEPDIKAQDLRVATGEPTPAFVVAHDVNHGVARMYEAFCDASPDTVQVFRDAGEALTWLGAPTDLVE